MSDELELKIDGMLGGEQVKPDTYPVGDLLLILDHLVDALKTQSAPDIFDARASGGLSLAAVSPGSVGLKLKSVLRPALISQLAAAIAFGDFSALKTETQRAVRAALNVPVNRDLTVSVGGYTNPRVYSKRDPVPDVDRGYYLSELTEITGFVNAIGNQNDPHAQVYLLSEHGPKGPRSVRVKMSCELCLSLSESKCLFRDVRFSGTAKWLVNEKPWVLVAFTATEFAALAERQPGTRRPLSEVLAEIGRAYAGGAWDDADPAEYVRSLREEDGGDRQ